MEAIAFKSATLPSGVNLPYAETGALLRRIPQAEQVVYKGVGHAVHLAHPSRVIEDVAAFLNRHASDSS